MVRKPFSLTYITYDSEDQLGPLWALLSLAPPFCVAALATVTVVSRDLRSAFVLLGLVSTSILCALLKKVLRQPRPQNHHGVHGLLDDAHEGGMPSNHTAFVFFAAVFCTLFAVRRCSRMRGPNALCRLVKRWVPMIGAWAIAFGCGYSRVHLGYHTWDQVFAGAAAGSIVGVLFFKMYEGVYCSSLGSYLESMLGSWDFFSPHDSDDWSFEKRELLQEKRNFEARGKQT
mmetsp:Transcript_11488/g.33860  ORF Transcript_11488/g.33860 Transcript_11488/m.33860 type:complete len:230 (-) Transcript_11488:1879-2568(-)